MTTKNTLIMLAGMVKTNFQFASHNKCMKNVITSIALPHEIANITAQPTDGVFMIGELATINEQVVKKHKARKTPTKVFMLP